MVERLGRGYRLARHRHARIAGRRRRTSSRRSSTGRASRSCCPEEIAYQQGWIDARAAARLAEPLAKNGYGQYLLALADGAFAGTD